MKRLQQRTEEASRILPLHSSKSPKRRSEPGAKIASANYLDALNDLIASLGQTA
jgi:hypothetical protein